MPELNRSYLRLSSLDALRGLSVVAMIVYHYTALYFPSPVDDITWMIHWIGNHVAALFFYLSGAGVWFFLQKYSPILLLKRGIFLFILASLVSVLLKWNWRLEWTLIQDVGFAFLLIALIALVTHRRFLAGIILYVVFGILTFLFEWNMTGFFPFFPGCIYFLIGYGFAAVCIRRDESRVFSKPMLIPLSLIVLTGLVATRLDVDALGERSVWYVDALGKINNFMMLYFLFVWLGRDWQFKGMLGNILLLIGRTTLTSYYIQQIILRFLQTINFQYTVINLHTSAFLLVSSLLILVAVILLVWKRLNLVMSLEWIMRKL